MTLAPVSLDEVRAHLNLDESDGHADDDEIWRTTLAAVGMVERRIGAIRPRTETVRAATRERWLTSPKFPVLSVASIVGLDNGASYTGDDVWFRATRVYLRSGCFVPGVYDLEVVVGQDPIVEEAVEAALLQTGLLWASQRGPTATLRYSAIGGEGGPTQGGDWARLRYILGLLEPVSAA